MKKCKTQTVQQNYKTKPSNRRRYMAGVGRQVGVRQVAGEGRPNEIVQAEAEVFF